MAYLADTIVPKLVAGGYDVETRLLVANAVDNSAQDTRNWDPNLKELTVDSHKFLTVSYLVFFPKVGDRVFVNIEGKVKIFTVKEDNMAHYHLKIVNVNEPYDTLTMVLTKGTWKIMEFDFISNEFKYNLWF